MNVDRFVENAREVLAVDHAGRPVCRDAARLYAVIRLLQDHGPSDAFEELVLSGWAHGRAERYAEHIAPLLRRIGPASFLMGTPEDRRAHFSGETPRHLVRLSAFSMAVTPVTVGMYALFDPERPAGTDPSLPVTNVTWFEASVFALWFGCRLPSEAEWEYCCGVGAESEWCCGDSVDEVRRYAWFSENADGGLRPVATREPNSLGLHDLHGNVWEWCTDLYSADFYAASPSDDPVNDPPTGALHDGTGGAGPHRVARGGSFQSLPEMCRTRYRLHDPAQYWAYDQGFRLAADPRGE